MPVGTNANLITIGTRWFKVTQPTDLASDATKGSRTVMLTSAPSLAVGEIVLVDQLPDPSITQWSTKSPPGDPSRGWFIRPNRPVGQVMEIASVNGSTVTFTTPFHIDMKRAFAAQLSRFSNVEGGRVIPSANMRALKISMFLVGVAAKEMSSLPMPRIAGSRTSSQTTKMGTASPSMRHSAALFAIPISIAHKPPSPAAAVMASHFPGIQLTTSSKTISCGI